MTSPTPAPGKSTSRVGDQLFTFGFASLGGLLGVVGAFVGEITHLQTEPVFAGPIIEEVAKPFGVYLLLLHWPHKVSGRMHTALLCSTAGVLFGLVEAVVYVAVYVDRPSTEFVLYRFTAPVALHAAASFVLGLGLTPRLLEATRRWADFPWEDVRFVVLAIGIHSVYNRVALVVGAVMGMA